MKHKEEYIDPILIIRISMNYSQTTLNQKTSSFNPMFKSSPNNSNNP